MFHGNKSLQHAYNSVTTMGRLLMRRYDKTPKRVVGWQPLEGAVLYVSKQHFFFSRDTSIKMSTIVDNMTDSLISSFLTCINVTKPL